VTDAAALTERTCDVSERYCQRCGEDAWDIFRCDQCGGEFCTDCGTRTEIDANVCAKCIRAAQATLTQKIAAGMESLHGGDPSLSPETDA
jgi:hypothetical protein